MTSEKLPLICPSCAQPITDEYNYSVWGVCPECHAKEMQATKTHEDNIKEPSTIPQQEKIVNKKESCCAKRPAPIKLQLSINMTAMLKDSVDLNSMRKEISTVVERLETATGDLSQCNTNVTFTTSTQQSFKPNVNY